MPENYTYSGIVRGLLDPIGSPELFEAEREVVYALHHPANLILSDHEPPAPHF